MKVVAIVEIYKRVSIKFVKELLHLEQKEKLINKMVSALNLEGNYRKRLKEGFIIHRGMRYGFAVSW